MCETKTITVKTIDADGNKIIESKLCIEEQEILVVKLPKMTSVKEAHQIHDVIKNTLDNKYPMVTIPDGITFQVIKVG